MKTAFLEDRYLRATVIVIVLLTILRLIILFSWPFDLGPDEAQYWSWSEDLAFGYFSKPPMIAWLIWMTTAPFGDAEAFVRLSSPLLHAGTSLIIFRFARTLYDARTGAWAALTFATLPSVFMSSGLITTDVPLLFFWSLALMFFYRLINQAQVSDALLTGMMIGFGLLSKYAMIYFVGCAALYLVFTPRHRWLLKSPLLLALLATIALTVSPNILWNASVGFVTFSHTAANANWQGDMFNPGEAFAFLGGQLGVFGPLLFPALLVGAWHTWAHWSRRTGDANATSDRFLLFFCLPVLGVALTQGFLSRANANWAAPAYVSATIFTVAWLARSGWPRLREASLGLHVGVGLLLYALILAPSLIDTLGLSNSFKRVRGWSEIGDTIRRQTDQGNYSAILGDDRLITAELLYYVRPRTPPLTHWKREPAPRHHYELTIPLEIEQGAHVLLVSRRGKPRDLLEHFDTYKYLGPVRVETGKGKSRTVHLFDLQGYKGRPGFEDDP